MNTSNKTVEEWKQKLEHLVKIGKEKPFPVSRIYSSLGLTGRTILALINKVVASLKIIKNTATTLDNSGRGTDPWPHKNIVCLISEFLSQFDKLAEEQLGRLVELTIMSSTTTTINNSGDCNTSEDGPDKKNVEETKKSGDMVIYAQFVVFQVKIVSVLSSIVFVANDQKSMLHDVRVALDRFYDLVTKSETGFEEEGMVKELSSFETQKTGLVKMEELVQLVLKHLL